MDILWLILYVDILYTPHTCFDQSLYIVIIFYNMLFVINLISFIFCCIKVMIYCVVFSCFLYFIRGWEGGRSTLGEFR